MLTSLPPLFPVEFQRAAYSFLLNFKYSRNYTDKDTDEEGGEGNDEEYGRRDRWKIKNEHENKEEKVKNMDYRLKEGPILSNIWREF